MLILLDMDGVLADFEHAFIDAWRARHPDIAPIAFEDRKSFHILEDYPPELRARAEAIYTAPGFIRNLPPVPGAIEAFRELLALGMELRICTSPLRQYENCVAEKFQWVEHHLGRAATERIVMTRDKTLVHGNLLIDDKPKIAGAVARPAWKHIIYDAPYNRLEADRPRLNWANWRNVLAGELYTADE
jgi:5'-nucleotidase